MLQLGSILHSKGFPISIAHTQFNFPKTLNHPNFNFLPIVDGFSNCNVSSVNFIDVISGFNSNCKAPLQELMAQMMEAKEYQDEITCIIYDEYMYFAEAVAYYLKLPTIILVLEHKQCYQCFKFPHNSSAPKGQPHFYTRYLTVNSAKQIYN